MLVVVEQRRAEVEQRRENEVGQEDGDAFGLVGLVAQQEAEAEPREEIDDRERRQRSERVRVVGTAQAESALDRRAWSGSFQQRDRNGKPNEREPGEAEQREPRQHERGGQEDGRADRDRRQPVAPAKRDRGREANRGRVGEREERREEGEHDDGDRDLRSECELIRDRQGDSEQEPKPEPAPVEADRLGDELANRALLGGKRGRKRTVGADVARAGHARER